MFEDQTERFRQLGETQLRGQATEAILKAKFLTYGLSVATPEYDNDPYDFLVDIGTEILRVQCKTAYVNGDDESTVRFETQSTKVRSDGYERTGYDGDIDYFAVHNPVHQESYLIPIGEAPKGKMEIRVEWPQNNQTKGINWHEDYLLEPWIESTFVDSRATVTSENED